MSDKWATREEVAAEFGIPLDRVASFVSRGFRRYIPSTTGNLYDLQALKEWVEAHDGGAGSVRGAYTNKRVAPELRDALVQARVAKEQAMADKHRHDLRVKQGKFMSREVVQEQRLERIAVVRAKLLALPGKYAGRLAGREAKDVQEELDKAVREVLEAFEGGGGGEKQGAVA